MPIQPSSALGIEGWIEIDPPYVEGLKDLEGFSHLILVYYFHRAGPTQLLVTPFLDNEPRGVFATRAPSRPNPLGISVVELKSIEKNLLHISNVDILDGTPLLDIKPYVPEFDHCEKVRRGWLSGSIEKIRNKVSDDRFTPGSENSET